MAQASVASESVGIAPPVADFIRSRTRRMLIDGKWVEAASGETFTTVDPATEEPLAEVAAGDREDLGRLGLPAEEAEVLRKPFGPGALSEPGRRARSSRRPALYLSGTGLNLSRVPLSRSAGARHPV